MFAPNASITSSPIESSDELTIAAPKPIEIAIISEKFFLFTPTQIKIKKVATNLLFIYPNAN